MCQLRVKVTVTNVHTVCFFSNCLQDTAAVVELKGVEYMNDDPADVDVLYAKVLIKDGSNR